MTMYTPIKSLKLLQSSPKVWAAAFNSPADFITWSKLVIKHIKKRQFTEIYGSYFIYCDKYIKDVSKVLKTLNLTLYTWIDTLIEYKIITRKESVNINNYIN